MHVPQFQFFKLTLKINSSSPCDSSRIFYQIRKDDGMDNAHVKKIWWKKLLD